MNALLEGDVARVGVIGIGAEPELRRARKRTRVGDARARARAASCTPSTPSSTRPRGLDDDAIDAALDGLQARGLHGDRGQRRVQRRRARARGPRRRARARARAAGLRRPRADRHLRPRDAHGLGRGQRLDPAGGRAHGRRRRARAARGRASTCRCSSCAATAARWRSTPSARAPSLHDRLGPGGGRRRGAAPARADRRDRPRVRRHELERHRRQGRAHGPARRCA